MSHQAVKERKMTAMLNALEKYLEKHPSPELEECLFLNVDRFKNLYKFVLQFAEKAKTKPIYAFLWICGLGGQYMGKSTMLRSNQELGM